MITVLADGRVRESARGFLPDNVQVEAIDLADDRLQPDCFADKTVLAAIALAGCSKEFRAALSGSTHARLPIVELDLCNPEAGRAELMRLLLEEVATSYRQVGEARAVAAQLRSENIGFTTRLREIEALLYSLGSPQFSKALSWQPMDAMLTLASGQSVEQALPINAVSLTAIDLWFPEVMMPVIDGLAVTIEDAAGQIYQLQSVSPVMGLETGWMRFGLAEPISGVGRDCRVKLTWSGDGSISLGLSQAVPDPRFRATLSTGGPDETLALCAWQSLGGVRLPASAPAFSGGRSISIREAKFVQASALPAPDLFAMPIMATDHVSAAFWKKEDAVLVHPSRSGPACAIIRGIDLAGLSHISALVNVAHARSPCLNFAVGVAPHGAVDEDGLWQRRLGSWVTGMPPQSWGQVHCIPVEPITGKADILLAVSLAADVPNELSWGLFRGFRFSRGEQSANPSTSGYGSVTKESAVQA